MSSTQKNSLQLKNDDLYNYLSKRVGLTKDELEVSVPLVLNSLLKTVQSFGNTYKIPYRLGYLKKTRTGLIIKGNLKHGNISTTIQPLV